MSQPPTRLDEPVARMQPSRAQPMTSGRRTVTCVTSSMFVTALAPNVLAADMALRTIHVTLSWTDWFRGFAPSGFLLLAIVPILLY